MKDLPANPSSFDDGGLQAIVRLVRRICLLTEQGDESAAERLEQHQLAHSVCDYRQKHGPGALSEERLAEIFVEEQKRAADAVVLAELLIPQLLGREQRAPLRAAAPTDAPIRWRAEPHTSIPDLLDAMIAGEAARRRSS